jgi:hypothetical protein
LSWFSVHVAREFIPGPLEQNQANMFIFLLLFSRAQCRRHKVSSYRSSFCFATDRISQCRWFFHRDDPAESVSGRACLLCVRSSACWIPFPCTVSGTLAKNSHFFVCFARTQIIPSGQSIVVPGFIFPLLCARCASPGSGSDRPFRSEYCVLLFDSIFVCDTCGLLQELIPVILLSHRIKRLEVSWFKSLSHGGFSNAPTRCLVKCL